MYEPDDTLEIQRHIEHETAELVAHLKGRHDDYCVWCNEEIRIRLGGQETVNLEDAMYEKMAVGYIDEESA